MKRFLLCLLAVVSAMGLGAQDIAGPWQGTATFNGKDYRVVLQVTKAGGVYKGKFFNIDASGGNGFTTSPVTADDGVLKFSLAGTGASYEGKISADAKSATGTWKQGNAEIPLELKHVSADAAWPIPAPIAQMKPMPADADPNFEVATIKPSKPDQPGKMFTVRGGRFVTINTTLEDLITFAYDVHPKQVSGLPPWAITDKFDVEAKPDVEGLPNGKQLKSMVRKLLTERYKLAFHHDKKELSVYALTVSKTGQKMTKEDSAPDGLPGLFFQSMRPVLLNVRNAKMTDFTQLLQAAVLDRPVVDQTGLKDRFDFQLKWTADESQFGGHIPPPTEAAPADAPPGLFTAVQEQLGLKLDPTKAQTDILVVDHVEKVSDN